MQPQSKSQIIDRYMSEQRQQLVEELKTLIEQDVTAVKDQVDHIKNQFYRLYHEEIEIAKKAAMDAAEAAGQALEEWKPEVDAIEEQLRALLAEYKTKKAEIAEAQAKEQAENLRRKQQIIEEVKTLAEGEAESVMGNLQRMRELQAEWKSIGAVPADKLSDLRKEYQRYQEQFYDLVKINIELRDLDFKKNLEMKTLLCEAVERLQNNENIVEASRALQQLHDEWAEIGPVARELREDIWNRFKAASTIINKKHQAYFDELHAKEQDNLAKKQAIIEQIKSIAAPIMQAEGKVEATKWDKASEQIQALQSEWRTIGFAPKKYNQSIYDEYRAACDAFFNAKTAYFKELREQLNANLQTKRTLIERAQDAFAKLQAAQEANETIQWNELAEQFRTMQVEWKAVGVVSRKYSDELWKQFSAACDQFFNAMRENKKVERENYQKRKEAAKAQFAKKLEHMNDAQKLYRMRDNLQQEIKTAENNILFFTSKSKTANKLVDDMQRKIDELKKQLADIQEKINQAED